MAGFERRDGSLPTPAEAGRALKSTKLQERDRIPQEVIDRFCENIHPSLPIIDSYSGRNNFNASENCFRLLAVFARMHRSQDSQVTWNSWRGRKWEFISCLPARLRPTATIF